MSFQEMNNMIQASSSQEPWFQICQRLLRKANIEINGKKTYDIQVKNNKFYKRVIKDGSLGLGESYMDGWWECDKLDEFIAKIIEANLDREELFNFKDKLLIASAKLIKYQSKKYSDVIGREHYELGNYLYELMLDPWMQYSCGYWKGVDGLCSAQTNKLKLICEKLHLSKGMTLLDVGCGWGGLAAFAAENYGVKVTGVTISPQQQEYAKTRCNNLDVEILLKDYRDINGTFDRIVSVGMFEHVGPHNYNDYFNILNNTLDKNGLFLLHTIVSNKTDVNIDPWINMYIFPNGCLPSISQITSASERYFILEDMHNFGSDYDKTLMAWFERFSSSWFLVKDSYSPRFKRMFEYYLKSCAGAFRVRNIQLCQFVFSRGVIGGYQSKR